LPATWQLALQARQTRGYLKSIPHRATQKVDRLMCTLRNIF
jgi:hypothetical protein